MHLYRHRIPIKYFIWKLEKICYLSNHNLKFHVTKTGFAYICCEENIYYCVRWIRFLALPPFSRFNFDMNAMQYILTVVQFVKMQLKIAHKINVAFLSIRLCAFKIRKYRRRYWRCNAMYYWVLSAAATYVLFWNLYGFHLRKVKT